MFFDSADGYPKLRRCGLVTQALETHEHESGSGAMRHARQGRQSDRSLLLGLQNPVGRQVVDRMVDRLQFAVRLAVADGVPTAAVQQDVGGRLENEAVEVGHGLAAATAVEPKKDLLDEVVHVMMRNAAAEEGPQRLLVMQRGLDQSRLIHNLLFG